jgi:hypothetical protein
MKLDFLPCEIDQDVILPHISPKLHWIHWDKSISTGTPEFVAGWAVLGALACPSWKLGLGSHTGAPKTPAPKFEMIVIFFINSNTYMFIKQKYYIVYTNK